MLVQVFNQNWIFLIIVILVIKKNVLAIFTIAYSPYSILFAFVSLQFQIDRRGSTMKERLNFHLIVWEREIEREFSFVYLHSSKIISEFRASGDERKRAEIRTSHKLAIVSIRTACFTLNWVDFFVLENKSKC